MAESCAVAFGRYLRTLRERRGLSLDDVESLSRAFPDPINKGYLSRCENGRQRIAFSKLIPLNRIYEVPSEVFVERMELDLELDRVGGPETEGLSFEELTNHGKQASARGEFLSSYGYLRDALYVASMSPVMDGFADSPEQGLSAITNFTIPAARLGRHRLARHELDHVRSVSPPDGRYLTTVFLLLSQRHLDLGHSSEARVLADQAIDHAVRIASRIHQARAYSHKALLSYREGLLDESIELYQATFSSFREEGHHDESARALLNLAQAYFDLNRTRSARRALMAAERIAIRHDLQRARALARILLGEILKKDGEPDKAVRSWRAAIEIAKRLRDQVTRFKAEFQLYRHALDVGDETAKSLERLLRRRATWLPEKLDELVEFKTLLAKHAAPSKKRVSSSQRR